MLDEHVSDMTPWKNLREEKFPIFPVHNHNNVVISMLDGDAEEQNGIFNE